MQIRLFILPVLLLSSSALAQLPAARLNAVFPPGAQSGATVEISVSGMDLDGATKLHFSHPGISATKATEVSRDSAKFTVTIGKDVPLGTYDCRIAGRFGISNPRAFVVGDREEVDAKPGASASAAGKLPLDRIVNARTTANVVDFWTFDAAKGQRVVIECDARSIDSKMTTSLAVVDAAGRELARSRRSGFLDFTAADAGTYTLRVSDLLYRGGPEFFYRLCVSTAPHIDSVFPPAGRPGASNSFTLLGRNLPGGKKSAFVATDGNAMEELEVKIDLPKDVPPSQTLGAAGLVGPSGAALDGFAYRLKSDKGLSNAVAIIYIDGDVTRDAEAAGASGSNDSPDKAMRLTLPATVAGRFYPRNDRDCYSFEAKKGDVYYIEVIADRLNQPISTSVILQKADAPTDRKSSVLEGPDDETNLGVPAFRTATRDPILKWDVKDDGVYQISVRDKFGVATSDPTRCYLLSIRKPSPDFQVIATPMSGAASDAALWNTLVRKGGSTPLRISVNRQDGYSGDVTIEAQDLPPGVTCAPATIPGGESSGLLVFSATNDVQSWTGELKLAARGKMDDREIARPVRSGTVVWGQIGDGKNNDQSKSVDTVISRSCRSLALGVCADEADPISVTPAEDKVYEVQQGTKISIPLVVKKSVELKQAMKLKLVGIDSFKNGRDVTIEPSSDKGTLDVDLNQAKLSPGTYSLCLASSAQIKYTRPGEPASADDKDKAKGKKKDDAKDATYTVYSAPITIKVLPKPEKEKKKG